MNNLLPMGVIEAAVGGDRHSLDIVLETYRKYILKLSTVHSLSSCGSSFSYVDHSIKDRLESKLLRRVLMFKL
jgi:hypothetical protein